MSEHFEVWMKNDGPILKFDYRCNFVDHSNEHLCVFMEKKENDKYEALALIPYENIERIMRVEE